MKNYPMLKWQELACKQHGLIHPSKLGTNKKPLLNLGHFRIIDSKFALEKIIEDYLRVVKQAAQRAASKNRLSKDDPDWKNPSRLIDDVLYDLAVLSYDDFIRFHGREDTDKKIEFSDVAYTSSSLSLPRKMARYKFASAQGITAFKPTFEGYKFYIKFTLPDLYKALSEDIPALIPDAPRQEHTYITSTTKTGKSELLKALIFNYIQQPDYAGVVMLDPGGDMVPQMARWPELVPSGRLVYIDPTLSKFNTPVINPFDADKLNEDERDLLTEQIVAAIGSTVEGKLGGSISVNMEALLTPCIRLLIDLPDTSLKDLSRLMKDDEDLIAAGQSSHIEQVAEFFSSEFTEIATLRPSKQSIVVKLRNILSKPILVNTLCGRTSIELERLMADRKIILVNLAKGRLGAASSSMFGTLLVSLISAIAMKRGNIKESERPMTHLIIDECQNVVTSELETIIRENRKFGLAVTLAQQEVGGGMSSELMNVVTSTTNVKIAGRSQSSQTKVTADLVGVTPDDIAGRQVGEFFYKHATYPPFLLRVRSDRLKAAGGVSNPIWKMVMEQQQQFFYRPIGEEVVIPDQQKTVVAADTPKLTKRKYEDFD